MIHRNDFGCLAISSIANIFFWFRLSIILQFHTIAEIIHPHNRNSATYQLSVKRDGNAVYTGVTNTKTNGKRRRESAKKHEGRRIPQNSNNDECRTSAREDLNEFDTSSAAAHKNGRDRRQHIYHTPKTEVTNAWRRSHHADIKAWTQVWPELCAVKAMRWLQFVQSKPT